MGGRNAYRNDETKRCLCGQEALTKEEAHRKVENDRVNTTPGESPGLTMYSCRLFTERDRWHVVPKSRRRGTRKVKERRRSAQWSAQRANKSNPF
jgi:hypothetical protein